MGTKTDNLLSYFGAFLAVAILILALFAGLSTVFGAGSSSVTSQVIVGNAAPSVTGVVLNHGNALTLTPNATTSFDINYTITDNNGCTDIVISTSTAFRNGVSATCATPNPTTSNLSCYLHVAQTTSTCQNGVTINGTDTVQIYYFADSTGNPSSTFPSDHWAAYVTSQDISTSTSASSSAVDVNVLTAINVTTSSINYGTLAASSTSALQNATGTNAGNSSTTLQLYALNTLTSGPNSIATSSQQYSTATFAFGDGVALTASPVTVSGYSLTKPTSTTNVAQTTFWLLGVPAGTATGTYTGTNVFSPIFEN
ncbi:MAG: hypothetical protein Q8P49_00775 [Candidatus Liptonbacteria bacterium]|nr:hypothetical protein [Candidatus Liptonbacteria bacterium]